MYISLMSTPYFKKLERDSFSMSEIQCSAYEMQKAVLHTRDFCDFEPLTLATLLMCDTSYAVVMIIYKHHKSKQSETQIRTNTFERKFT
jgi:hypothetical protein